MFVNRLDLGIDQKKPLINRNVQDSIVDYKRNRMTAASKLVSGKMNFEIVSP